jgi:hypothetical protein
VRNLIQIDSSRRLLRNKTELVSFDRNLQFQKSNFFRFCYDVQSRKKGGESDDEENDSEN